MSFKKKSYKLLFKTEKNALKRQKHLENNNYSQFLTEQYYTGSKKNKSEICNNLKCHFMIDDSIDVLNNIKKYNTKIITILFCTENNYNDFIPEHIKVMNWKQIIDIISNTT